MPTMTTTPQVWIGCLAAYNAGRLHGRWVDATDADEMAEAAAHIIKTSPAWQLDGHAEETFIADYDNFPGAVVRELGEYASYETVANVANAIEDADDAEAFAAWLDWQEGAELSDDDLGEKFQESYRGEWDSERAYVDSWIEESGLADEVPEHLRGYLDEEAIGRDFVFRHGPYSYVNGYVFEDMS